METTTKQQSNEVKQAPASSVSKARTVRVTKKQEKENARNEAIATLRRLGVKPGTDIYTIVTHVSKSGMSRHVRCYLHTKDGIENITGLVAVALEWRRSHGANWDLIVEGCGMDMCFHTVYTLGQVMFRETNGGYMLNKRDL